MSSGQRDSVQPGWRGCRADSHSWGTVSPTSFCSGASFPDSQSPWVPGEAQRPRQASQPGRHPPPAGLTWDGYAEPALQGRGALRAKPPPGRPGALMAILPLRWPENLANTKEGQGQRGRAAGCWPYGPATPHSCTRTLAPPSVLSCVPVRSLGPWGRVPGLSVAAIGLLAGSQASEHSLCARSPWWDQEPLR